MGYSWKTRKRHSRLMHLYSTIPALGIISVLALLDIVPISNTVAWLLLVAAIVGVCVVIFDFKGKKPE